MTRWILPLLIVVVSANAAPALTAGNSGVRGGGSNGVSGYVVSDVHYELADDAAAVERVTFRLAPADATTVRVRLSSDGPWHDCTARDGVASCELPGNEPLAAIDSLTVAAIS